MKSRSNIIINLYGSGAEICCDSLSDDILLELNNKSAGSNLPIEHAFFDLDFFEQHTIIKDDKRVTGWRSFSNQGYFAGADLLEAGYMEIWINKKRLKPIHFNTIIQDTTLFPLYNLNYLESESLKTNTLKSLVCGIKQKGLIAKYQFQTEHFDMNRLEFNVFKLENPTYHHHIIYEVKYNNSKILALKKDTLITGCIFHLD